MSSNAALLQQAKNTEYETDHSVPTAGGPRLPVPGKCPARLVGYIELGVHPQKAYAGKEKGPEMEVQLVFECFGAKNVDDIEVDGKTKKVGRIVRPFAMTMKVNERANFFKTFKSMDYGRGMTNMGQMLNDVFRLTISHGKAKSGAEYAKIDAIESPLVEQIDPDTGEVVGSVDITDKVQPASWDLQMFVVSKPTFEQWESIFIDGTYERKIKDEDGKATDEKEEVSKNFIQEKIMSALDWEGSAMQALLLDLEEPVEEEVVEEVKEVEKKPVKTTKKTTKKTTSPTKTKAKAEKEEVVESDADLMAELGL